MTVAPNTISLDSNSAASGGVYGNGYYQWPTYPTYTYTVQGDDARLRLALELIADCATVEEAQRIAAKALRISDD